MKQLVYNAVYHCFQNLTACGVLPDTDKKPLHLILTYLNEFFLHLPYQGADFSGSEPVHKTDYVFMNYLHPFGNVFLACLSILLHDLGKVIYTVEIHVVYFIHRRLEVPWHGDVDNQKYSLSP